MAMDRGSSSQNDLTAIQAQSNQTISLIPGFVLELVVWRLANLINETRARIFECRCIQPDTNLITSRYYRNYCMSLFCESVYVAALHGV